MTYKIPLLDLKKQIAPIRREVDFAIKEVIDNANFVLGKQIDELEDEICRYCNIKYAVGVSNGTDAIRLALIALGIKEGDGIICPTFTFYASAGAIAAMGAVPVFADIDPLTYNISVSEIERILKSRKKLKIKAVLPVHLYGQCADMSLIMKLAAKYGLKVVEDTAQGFGAEYRGKKAGAIGHCGTVSFFPGKNLGAFGDAGMVLTNNKSAADKIRTMRNQGSAEKYNHVVIGYNNRLDTLQAAVLKVKLKHLDSWNQKRQENAKYFNAAFKGLPVHLPFVPEYNMHIYHHYVLRLDRSAVGLIEHLKGKGIDSRVYYPIPLHLQKCFKYLGYKKGAFPHSEKAAQETLSIPVHPDLSKREMDYIISSVKEGLK